MRKTLWLALACGMTKQANNHPTAFQHFDADTGRENNDGGYLRYCLAGIPDPSALAKIISIKFTPYYRFLCSVPAPHSAGRSVLSSTNVGRA